MAKVQLFINPWTNERFLLLPDYPDLLYGALDFRWADVAAIYDSTLSRVVYPGQSMKEQYLSYIIYDLHEKRITGKASLPLVSRPPVWAPDSNSFAVVSDRESGKFTDEIYNVGTDGAVKRLTNLYEFSQGTNIDRLSWSPDGSQIAFWARTVTRDYQEVGILDIETHKITIFCLKNENGRMNGYESNAPIWSPDGYQLMVSVADQKNNHFVVLIDHQWMSAVQLLQPGLSPRGWLP